MSPRRDQQLCPKQSAHRCDIRGCGRWNRRETELVGAAHLYRPYRSSDRRDAAAQWCVVPEESARALSRRERDDCSDEFASTLATCGAWPQLYRAGGNRFRAEIPGFVDREVARVAR